MKQQPEFGKLLLLILIVIFNMLQSNTTLDILVNGEQVDILDRSSINLRINNVIYDPTEIKNKQAEYSFSFNLPTTPNNNKIFDYANELSKLNKFKNIYNCEVYVDGDLIFEGSLRISKIQKGFYNVNLVNIKINTVEDIFGDMKLNEIDWSIPFEGISSINSNNADLTSKVFFPLVSYGVFQKTPLVSEYSDIENYTSKFVFDKSNKWYYETFSPSLNLLETVKRLFEQKGYKVEGNVLDDEVIQNLYMSTNLADEQIPVYNLGNPNFGTASITCEFSNYTNKNTGTAYTEPFLEHSLSFPYLDAGYDNWNWDKVDIYDLWAANNSKITIPPNQYLFDEQSNCIVIPATGLYKIKVTATASLPSQTVEAQHMIYWMAHESVTEDITLETDFNTDMPIEIQLVRNTNECELIHGVAQEDYYRIAEGAKPIRGAWNTAYPHETPYGSPLPTTNNALYGGSSYEGGYVWDGRNIILPSFVLPDGSQTEPGTLFQGFMPKFGELLAYDPWVNPNFIMGISTYGPAYLEAEGPRRKGTPSVIKNGYSWNSSSSDKNNSRYEAPGYYRVQFRGIETESEQTTYNRNKLLDSPTNSVNVSAQSMTGSVSAVVQLNRNDVITLKALARHWAKDDNTVTFKFDCNVTVEISAYSPNTIESMDYNNRGWNSPTEFPTDLQLGEFLNKETDVSDFINNFLDEFNISYRNEGKTVYLDKQQLSINTPKYAINIDDRVNDSEYEASVIEYPSYLQVAYDIDTEEWGFEQSVPLDKVELPDWKDYGDYGSDKIEIDDRGDNTGEELSLDTSYCWYDEFTLVDENNTELAKFNIPVISKSEYMIDGYSYEESMKEDGKGLPLRYWFRNSPTNFSVNVNNKYPVFITTTSNTKDGFELSYKNKEGTLLTRYFNITPNLSSNFVDVEIFLTAQEYLLLKNGADVIYNSDVYVVSEIGGFDAMGLNKTQLTLIKKESYAN